MNLPLFEFSWVGYLLVAIVFTHITIICVTLYLHRHQAHHSIDLHPVVSHFFRLWLWLNTGMTTWEWVATHRKHHAKVETEQDPHSPQIHGLAYFFKLLLPPKLLGGVALYRKAITTQADDLQQYRHGTPNDWIERNLYIRFSFLGIIIMLTIDIILFGLIGFFIWLIQLYWIPFWAAGVINGVGHHSGYRNYETADASRNIVPWGIIVGGEELHNNHHAYASSAKFSIKPWEFDIGWLYIKILSFFNLAKVRKTAPRIEERDFDANCDLDTLKTLFNNKLQVMANFTQQVIEKVCNEESSKIKHSHPSHFKAIKRAYRLMRKEHSSLDIVSSEKLQSILIENANLKKVYQMKLQLQEICSAKFQKHQNSSLYTLQQWCNHAEESGITALQEFAFRLKGYSVIK